MTVNFVILIRVVIVTMQKPFRVTSRGCGQVHGGAVRQEGLRRDDAGRHGLQNETGRETKNEEISLKGQCISCQSVHEQKFGHN